MTYAQALAVKETRAEFERRMAMHNTEDAIVTAIFVIAVVGLIWLTVMDIRHRREMKRRAKEQAEREIVLHSFGSDHYRPTVTGERQIVNGKVFVKMGPPTEWRD